MTAEDGETADAADGMSTDVGGKLIDPTTKVDGGVPAADRILTADRKLIDDAMVDAQVYSLRNIFKLQY